MGCERLMGFGRARAAAAMLVLVMILMMVAGCGGGEEAAGELHTGGLVVEDAQGRSRIVMKVGDDGMPYVRLLDSSGHCRLELKVTDPGWGARERKEREKEAVEEYDAWSGGMPSITMYDKGDKPRMKLGIGDGWSGLRIYRSDGALSVDLAMEWGKGGALRMLDRWGNARAQLLEHGSGGKPQLLLWDGTQQVSIVPK